MSVLQRISAFLLACWLTAPTAAQVPFLGNCPDVDVVKDFQPSRYLGKWYEAEKYFAIFQLGGKCVTAEYTDEGNGVIGVFNKQLSSLTGVVSEIKGEAMQVGRNEEAKLSVQFPSLPVNFAAPYWVVDTDYDNYAVVWGCNDFGILHTRNAWILTREKNPPLSALEKAYAAIDKNNISRAYFMRTDQKTCSQSSQYPFNKNNKNNINQK